MLAAMRWVPGSLVALVSCGKVIFQVLQPPEAHAAEFSGMRSAWLLLVTFTTLDKAAIRRWNLLASLLLLRKRRLGNP